jgi:hypothetical protein
MTGSPDNYLYWHNIEFKDKTKMEEWLNDNTHTTVTSISYPEDMRDYYLPIFTKMWLTTIAKPVY